MASTASFRFGTIQLPPDTAVLVNQICVEQGLATSELYCKWEAWALSHNKSTDAPSAEDLKELATYIRSRSVKNTKTAPITPEKAAFNAIYTAGPGPTSCGIDDFFSYLNEDELPEDSPMPAETAIDPNKSPVKTEPQQISTNDAIIISGAHIGKPREINLAGDDQVDDMYIGRDGSGRVEIKFNGGVEDFSNEKSTGIKVRQVETAKPIERYMNDDVDTKIRAIRERLRDMSERILARIKDMRADDSELPKLSAQSFTERSPDVVLAAGRIRVELDGSEGVASGGINANSVILESEDGYRVKLDLSRMQEQKQAVFLNPGMIVVVEGVNTNGRIFQVHAIYDNGMRIAQNVKRPVLDAKVKEESKMEDVEADDDKADGQRYASVIFAAGPYTTSKNLNYEPLEDLLGVIAKCKPDVVVLAGPFVDTDHEQISETTNVEFEDIFEARIMNRLRQAVSSMAIQLIVIPSLSDVHHDFVCPQPAFRLGEGQGTDSAISLMPNPCVIQISTQNEQFKATVGISSLPTIQDISSDCICWNKGDRFSAIVSHMLRQCCFYPTFPPSAAVPLDTCLYDNLALQDVHNSCSVDVIVCPSKLKAFVKSVDGGAVAVNPGILSRGSSGGTYAEVSIPLHHAARQTHINANADKLRASIVRL